MKPVHRPETYRGFFIETRHPENGWELFLPTPFGTRSAAGDRWRQETRLIAKGWLFRVKLHQYEMSTSGLMKLDARPVPEHQRVKRHEG